METRISAVIVTYNGRECIRRCLDSVENSACKINAIAVDNNSRDGTADIIRRDYPGVRLICLNENLGFGRANNIGISEAVRDGADYILLLNQDAWISPDMAGRLAGLFSLNAGFGVLSPVHWHRPHETLDGGFWKYTGYRPSGTYADGALAVKFVNAAVWLAPASVFRKVGGFDPAFFHCGEDVDFVNRLHYHGYAIGYCPNAHAAHGRDQNRKRDKSEQLRGIYIYIYILLKDINAPFPVSLTKAFYYVASQIAKRPEWSWRILALFAKSVADSRGICRTRKRLKREGPHFLDLSC